MKYDKKFMNSAYEWSEYSYCKRKQVGAVLTRDNREIASGYNGTVSGSTNSCEDEFYECVHCKKTSTRFENLFSISRGHSAEDPFMSNNIIRCLFCEGHNTSGSLDEIDNKLKHTRTRDSTIHAERNVIAYCAKHGIPTDGCTMYITLSPCQGCATLMVQSGIKRVVYANDYKGNIGIKILKESGVEITKV